MKQRSQDEPQVCSEQLGECSCVTWDRGPAGYRGTLCGLSVSQRCQQNVQVKALSGRLDIACCLGDRSRLAAKAPWVSSAKGPFSAVGLADIRTRGRAQALQCPWSGTECLVEWVEPGGRGLRGRGGLPSGLHAAATSRRMKTGA